MDGITHTILVIACLAIPFYVGRYFAVRLMAQDALASMMSDVFQFLADELGEDETEKLMIGYLTMLKKRQDLD
jgi:hypothetical protein|tara:strand:- start:4007 stop:4225 length:219 start_codon:yes stop_codon:yes gene_type:complete